MQAPSATVPISIVNGFLAAAGVKPKLLFFYLEQAGISPELCGETGARVTEEQFSTLYRTLAIDLDDEMPGIFSRPFRSGTLKFLCLSLLDARNLEDLICEVELCPNPSYGTIGPLGQEFDAEARTRRQLMVDRTENTVAAG